MKFYLCSLGCDKNLVDSEVMVGLLQADGFVFVEEPADADALIVNTCGFIQDAVNEAIETILRLARDKRDGQALIVTGCMAQRYKDEVFNAMPEVDAVLGVNDFPKIVDIARAVLRGDAKKIRALDGAPTPNAAPPSKAASSAFPSTLRKTATISFPSDPNARYAPCMYPTARAWWKPPPRA
jgi:ribosomal protein S12 methylthiotransferase